MEGITGDRHLSEDDSACARLRVIDGARMPEPAPSSRVIRFGVFEADLGAGELRKNGSRVKLQDRPFEILTILLERPGQLVTREEFRQRLWPVDTFVDFDHSLNASINKIRQTLDDSADNPRFVATVGRRGYRFVAPVDGSAQPTQRVTDAGTKPFSESGATARTAAPSAETPSVAETSPARREVRKRMLLAGVLAAALLALALIVVGPRLRSKAALKESDFILISDFVNTTGEPVFDDTLKQALAVKLTESPFLNVVPDGKARETLALMGRSPNDRVVPPVDREVCQRSGAKVVVEGSILSYGGKYAVQLKALDCLKGETQATEQFEAQSQGEVLHGLGQVLPNLRRKLGESIGSIQKFDTPIEQATTTSLAALKAYTEGDKQRALGLENEALPSYKLATELDPNFAIAYVRLGAIYSNSQERVLAAENLRKAFDRREHVSEREKLYIAAHYYVDATHESEKGIQTYELWHQIYPRDWIPVNNLANECIRVGRLDKAIEASQIALRLNPNHSFPYVNLARSYKRSARYAEAKTICEKTMADKRDGVDIHSLLYEIAFAEQNDAAMRSELEWAKGKPREGDLILDAAWAALAVGQLRRSRALYQQAREAVLREDLKEYAAAMALEEAQFEVDLGNQAEARREVELAFQLAPHLVEERADAALTLARAGDTVRAEAIVQELSKQLPLDTLLNSVKLAAVRAAIALSHNDPQRAIEALQPAIPYDLSEDSGLTLYYRGLAYLQQHSGKEAAGEFQKILDHPTSPVSPYIPLARLGLGRALTLSGETDRSRRAYDEFFALWKNADLDIRILRQAKSEYAKFK
jgi:DNA-binding winged helix-turn-helix (wHTH) protein/tetratricopeptide (TPR) repeat protein